MNGPPPCAYGHPCLWDDEAGVCDCDDDQPPEDEPRPVVDVPVGHYL
ncbi:hypothetical protein I3W98_28020 [Streptomyces cavourensis]|nr:hypothetical protein [Streptomyces cavourensis]